MRDAFLLSALRTPTGAFGKALRDVPAPSLAAPLLREALNQGGLAPDQVDEVMLGQVFQSGCGPNPARLAAAAAGLPHAANATTLNQLCGSGMRTVALGAQAIACGSADVVLAGGMESLSQVPYLLPEARWGQRMGASQAQDALLTDGLECPLAGLTPGPLVERLARSAGISREAQDAFAWESHQRATAAHRTGAFRRELLPLDIRRGRRSLHLDHDESVRAETSVAALSALAPAFEPQGTLTAGNSSGLSDGAAVLLLASPEAARDARPRARIVAWAQVGVEPAQFGLGPVPAIRKALAQSGLALHQMDRVELNEAFAAQALAVLQALPDLDPARVNVRGGALALGHPVGASGARILVTLLHTLEDEGLRYGLAALCVGGGQGLALILERLP